MSTNINKATIEEPMTTDQKEYLKCLKVNDGPTSLMHFSIAPAKILNYDDTLNYNNVEIALDNEITIEETFVYDLLLTYFLKYFDKDLKENKCRKFIQKFPYGPYGMSGFQGTGNNYFTFYQIEKIIGEIKKDIGKYNDKVQEFLLSFIEHMNHMVEGSKENDYPFIRVME